MSTCSVLGDILGSPAAAAHALPRHPELLTVDLPAAHAALCEIWTPHGIGAEAAVRIVSADTGLLAADVGRMRPVLEVLAAHGIQVRRSCGTLSLHTVHRDLGHCCRRT